MDIVLQCKKCYHNIYVEQENFITKFIKKVEEFDCPECGEQGYENWILIGEGDYESEFGDQQDEQD